MEIELDQIYNMDVLEEFGVDVKKKYEEIMHRAEQLYKERYPNRK